MSEIRHGGLIALPGEARWRGVLILGPSGSGKSDLALRCLEQGFSLVADDQVILWRSGEAVYGRSPSVLNGLIEVRGLGVLTGPCRHFSRVDLVCDLCPADAVERMPDSASELLFGCAVPRLALAPWEASAPAKLRRALIALGTGPQRA